MIGLVGEVTEWEGNHGKVLVHGEIWEATCEENLSKGDQIEVMEIHDYHIKVRRKYV